jgi:hypothetical protein
MCLDPQFKALDPVSPTSFRKFDHHCVLINTCVNYANYKYFLLAMGYGMALCVLGICGTVPHLGKAWRVFRFRLSVVETGWW